MTKLDIAILIVIGIIGFSGYKVGFTRSVWGILALGTGRFMASQCWQNVAALIQKFINNDKAAKWISIIVIVIVITIVIDIILGRIQRIFENGVLGGLNRLLGLGIGIAASAIAIAVALSLLNPHANDTLKDEIANSSFAAPLMDLGDHVCGFRQDE